MAPTHETLRLLLVQARNTQDIELQEQQCFLERCRIQPHQLRAVNVVRDALPASLLDTVDVMMIGGAGEYSAQNDYPWMSDLLQLVQEAAERNLPTFGSCWGHQIIARALGGTVVYDAEMAEIGCLPVLLNDVGHRDPLFKDFPSEFLANMGHHDRVVELPESAVSLAYSTTQDYQAFRIDGKPMYGTQFHSELDAAAERERLFAYRDLYPEIGSDNTFQAIIDSLAETTEVDGLLYAFLQRFVVRSS